MVSILSFKQKTVHCYKWYLLRTQFQWKIWCSSGLCPWSFVFLLFINDLHLCLNNAIIKLFADDTTFFIAEDNFDLLRVTVTSELQSFQEWIYANKLTSNYDPQKSSYSVFKSRNKQLPNSYKSSLHVGGREIKYKENTKYFGMILDDQLTWEKHITEVDK